LVKKAQDIERTKTIFETTVERMKSLGVYKTEYDGIIYIYSQLCEQYETLTLKFEKSKYEYESFTAAGGAKKAPIVATLETLRKDILGYSDRLCLNPKAYDAMNIKPAAKASKLDKAMDALQDD
jgi:phage terminase small subunit